MNADERGWMMPLVSTMAVAFVVWLGCFFANGGIGGWLDRSYKHAMDAAGEAKVREFENSLRIK
jgi:hypothetical protein